MAAALRRRQPDDDGDDDLSAANSSHSKLVASIGNAQRSYVRTYVLGNEGKNKIRGVGSVHTTYVFDVSHPLSMRAILVHHCTAM